MTGTSNDLAFDPESYARLAASLVALPLDLAWMPSIATNLLFLQAAADLVGTFPLPDETEVAPVFSA